MKLKPCPFCGNTETEIIYDDKCYTSVRCNRCYAQGPSTDGPHLSEIGWNNHVSEEN